MIDPQIALAAIAEGSARLAAALAKEERKPVEKPAEFTFKRAGDK